ncbi:hypothetical protein PJI16_02905 [Nitrospira sp. MA-1]|nr:hypothetical protein [Nitrospira sp. MA-1]
MRAFTSGTGRQAPVKGNEWVEGLRELHIAFHDVLWCCGRSPVGRQRTMVFYPTSNISEIIWNDYKIPGILSLPFPFINSAGRKRESILPARLFRTRSSRMPAGHDIVSSCWSGWRQPGVANGN